MTAAMIPGSPFEVRLGNSRPAHAVYLRRRLVVGLVACFLVALIVLGARAVLADRGGVPASTPTIRPASGPAAALATPLAPVVATAAATYIVRPGDTLWSIGETFHGGRDLTSYVDALVATNGGTGLEVGQALVLP